MGNHEIVAVIRIRKGVRVADPELDAVIETLFARQPPRRLDQRIAQVDAHDGAREARALRERT
jgi:hypothetical protein